MNSSKAEGPQSSLQKTTMLVLAVTLHNLPKGMAVGVVYTGWFSGDAGITAVGVLALSLRIAIQNFPEGAIISMPLRAEGVSYQKRNDILKIRLPVTASSRQQNNYRARNSWKI